MSNPTFVFVAMARSVPNAQTTLADWGQRKGAVAPRVLMEARVVAARVTAGLVMLDNIVRSQYARRNAAMEAGALVPTDVPVSMGLLAGIVRLTTGQDHATGV